MARPGICLRLPVCVASRRSREEPLDRFAIAADLVALHLQTEIAGHDRVAPGIGARGTIPGKGDRLGAMALVRRLGVLELLLLDLELVRQDLRYLEQALL